MKKLLTVVFIVAGLIGFLFLNKKLALLGINIPLFSVPNGHVRVDFVNESNESIKAINLLCSEGNQLITNIGIGERRTITYIHSGEGTYQFVVDFDSGRQIIEGDRYVEGGYFLREHIFSTIVKTDY